MDYRKKYLKYKNKYLELKSYSQLGGSVASTPPGCIPEKGEFNKFIYNSNDKLNYPLLCSKTALGVTFMVHPNTGQLIINSSSVGLIYQTSMSIDYNKYNIYL